MVEKYLEWSPYNYVANNSLNSTDPDGRSIWDVICGVANSIVDNSTVGLAGARKRANYSNSSHGRIGEQIGNGISLVQSLGEYIVGGAGVAGGGTVTVGSAGTLAVVGVPAVAGGVALVGHGTSVLTMAIDNMMAGNGNGRSDENSAQDKKLTKGEIKKLKKSGEDIHALKGKKIQVREIYSKIKMATL